MIWDLGAEPSNKSKTSNPTRKVPVCPFHILEASPRLRAEAITGTLNEAQGLVFQVHRSTSKQVRAIALLNNSGVTPGRQEQLWTTEGHQDPNGSGVTWDNVKSPGKVRRAFTWLDGLSLA